MLSIAKHTIPARQVLSSQSSIDTFEEHLLNFYEANEEALSSFSQEHDTGTLNLKSTDELRSSLGCVNGRIPGMNPDAAAPKWHQLHAIDWSYSKIVSQESVSLLLADAAGLGKTLIVLGLLMRIRCWSMLTPAPSNLLGASSLGELGGPVVIVCPSSIQTQWMEEYNTWSLAGAWEAILYPTVQLQRPTWWTNIYRQSNTPVAQRIIIVTHKTLSLEHKEFDAAKKAGKRVNTLFDLFPWLLVIDEAHMARNEKTELFKALLALSKQARSRLLLTATPIHNQIENVLTMMTLMRMQLTEDEGQIIKHIRINLPLFRQRAHKFLAASIIEKPPQDFSMEDGPIIDDRSLIDRIGFGEDFLKKIISIIRYILQDHYLRRDYDSKDWQGQPVLSLPEKLIYKSVIDLTLADRLAYDQEREVVTMSGSRHSRISKA
jgi:SNF2 family DNA or RNA helicase